MSPKRPTPPNGPSPDPSRADGKDRATPHDALFAPWRRTYLESLDGDDGSAGAGARSKRTDGVTFLSDYWARPHADAAHHVIVRNAMGMIMLNKYPYANGHLLVALGEPRARLMEYEPAQRTALWGLVDLAMVLVEHTLEPQGVNVGINQGRAAGAGVPSHLHVHLMPRWAGDVNFITTVGQVRVIPSALEQMFAAYQTTWGRIKDDPSINPAFE